MSSNWRQSAELVGIMAVVASLIFVGLQLKQSQEIAIAAQYHNRAALAVENFNAELESGDLRFWGSFSGLEVTKDRSIEDLGELYLRLMKFFLIHDNHFYQYQSGFMAEEAWQARYSGLKNALSVEEVRFFLKSQSSEYRASFIDLCSEIVEKYELE